MSYFFPLNPILTIVATGMVIFALSFLKERRRTVRGLNLPPGPTPLPFVGNLLSIDSKEPWKTYATWASRYGDVFMIRILKQDIIVVNSERITKDLFERRSNIYSDRPYLASQDPFGFSFHFAWAPYGDRWRSQRRIFHQAFRAEASLAYRPAQLKNARRLVLDILSTPHDYYSHIQRFSAAIIMSNVYDYEVAPDHDHLVKIVEVGSALAFQNLTPETSSIIDAFPFILSLPAWFPGTVIRRKAELSRDYARKMVVEPFKHAEKRWAEGSTAPAMALELLKRHGDTNDPSQLQLLKDTCATAYVAGAETTTSSLRWFILAMLQHPKVQECAQAEIDAVVGTDRLPNFDDRPNLPYVEAIFMETLRMYVIVPLGVPHSTIADDVYEDIFIPKGSTVVPNVWAMCHNEDVFQESNVFKPERFFKDGKFTGERPIDNLVFGFGRRVCPGRHTADSAIWAAMVSILYTFRISKARDEQGKELYVESGFSTGVTTQPDRFPCSITPRLSDGDIHKLSTADI